MTPHAAVLAALGLASCGRPDEASALLRASPAALETEAGLDLLARLELAAGREEEARRLWARALASGHGTRRARRALAALDSFPWRHRRAILALRAALLLAAYAIIVLFAIIGIRAVFRP